MRLNISFSFAEANQVTVAGSKCDRSRAWPLRATFLSILLLLTSTIATYAQQSSSAPPTIESLEREVQELRLEVAALEAKLPPQPPPPVATAQGAAVPDTSSSPPQPWLAKQAESMTLRGFGELDYKALDQRSPEIGGGGFVPGSAANFYTGSFDLLVTAPITPRAHVLSEIDFQEVDAQDFKVDVDRLLLTYDFRNWLRASAGRYQTAIGYYNTAFMSSAWPQTTVDRPLLMAFPDEGGVLPVQAIGLFLQGAIPSGRLGLNYLFEYGSSDMIRTQMDGTGSRGDENNGNQVNVSVFVRPDWARGLQIGGSFYHDNISDDRNLSVRYGQTILNAHLVYIAHGFEFLNEGVLIRHAEVNGPLLFNMPGAYSLISKKFAHVRPFFRYQYLNTNPQSILHDVLLRYGPSFGARYDFNPRIAMKLQFDHTQRKTQPDLNGVQAQLAFAF